MNCASTRTILLISCLTLLSAASSAEAAIVLAEFDVTNAISSSSAPIPLVSTAPGVTSSPLIPVGVNFDGTSTPGLYWDSSWTTSAIPNFLTERLFFNVFADSGVTLEFDELQFHVYSGGSSLMGVELRVFGAGNTTIASPQLISGGFFNSPSNFATEIIADVSSLVPLSNGDAYQFSLSFFNRNPASRIGLSGDRSDIGILGGNVILTGESSAVPEPASLSMASLVGLLIVAQFLRRRRARCGD